MLCTAGAQAGGGEGGEFGGEGVAESKAGFFWGAA